MKVEVGYNIIYLPRESIRTTREALYPVMYLPARRGTPARTESSNLARSSWLDAAIQEGRVDSAA